MHLISPKTKTLQYFGGLKEEVHFDPRIQSSSKKKNILCIQSIFLCGSVYFWFLLQPPGRIENGDKMVHRDHLGTFLNP